MVNDRQGHIACHTAPRCAGNVFDPDLEERIPGDSWHFLGDDGKLGGGFGTLLALSQGGFRVVDRVNFFALVDAGW